MSGPIHISIIDLIVFSLVISVFGVVFIELISYLFSILTKRQKNHLSWVMRLLLYVVISVLVLITLRVLTNINYQKGLDYPYSCNAPPGWNC